MIFYNWSSFRAGFATGSTLDVDGTVLWPVANLGINGFAGTIPKVSAGSSVTVTCNGGESDSAAASTYDWYLSQRTDDHTSHRLTGAMSSQCWKLTEATPGFSGTIHIAQTSNVCKLIIPAGSLFTADSLDILCNRCDLYVQRKADMAIQYLPFRQLFTV